MKFHCFGGIRYSFRSRPMWRIFYPTWHLLAASGPYTAHLKIWTPYGHRAFSVWYLLPTKGNLEPCPTGRWKEFLLRKNLPSREEVRPYTPRPGEGVCALFRVNTFDPRPRAGCIHPTPLLCERGLEVWIYSTINSEHLQNANNDTQLDSPEYRHIERVKFLSISQKMSALFWGFQLLYFPAVFNHMQGGKY